MIAQNIDFIGDVHGHAEDLKNLLEYLGYKKSEFCYYHPDNRKAVFMGDLIDRGPAILEVLRIVKAMADNGNAIVLIGNHEYNFICYFTEFSGIFLRSHSQKNNSAIKETIAALNNDNQLITYYLKWFRSLPIYIDHPLFRAVHAQWKQQYINKLSEWNVNNFSDSEFLQRSAIYPSLEFKIISCLLKAEEVKVAGIYFHDNDGPKRESYRKKWWMKGENLKGSDYLIGFPKDKNDFFFSSEGYDENNVPVFFGHYCMKHSPPHLQSKNICCLDYCISKGGKLISYKFDGEKELFADKLCYLQ